ncbi:MAG: ATP-dependent helicase [Candidatus Vogelbacteria bacterium]|nr:ATP-dependent helicase [Candidatus Vogelbacteria bacterium]
MELNEGQKQAIEAVEGPVMVVAGPGTGKTQVLTLRIANILRVTDTAPANILALTFTEAATANMRSRLAEIIGSRAYAVVINTFHGFCNSIIREYPEHFPRIIGSRPITEVDQVRLVEQLVGQLSLNLLKPFGDPTLYVRSLVAAINDLKREGVTPEKFAILVGEAKNELNSREDRLHTKGAYKGKIKGEVLKAEKDLAKNEELAQVYIAYQNKLAIDKVYDYNDMIMEVLAVLQDDEILRQILQEEHQYILIDEHQDTNNAHNKIIELLASFHSEPNLFVVGDEKQAIFRFQGASLQNFLYFKKLYPNALLITLTDNYRSQQTILDAAHSLLPATVATGGIEVRLASKSAHLVAPILVAAFSKPEVEQFAIASLIKIQIEAGTPAEEIAVLYRDNKDAFLIARALARIGINYIIESDQDLFTQSDVRRLLIILEAVHRFGDDEPLAKLLHLDLFKLDPLLVYQVIRRAAQTRQPLYRLIKTDPDFKAIYAKLANWRKLATNENLLTLFEQIIWDSGLLNQILTASNATERFESISRLVVEVGVLLESHPEATLADWFNYLATVQTHGLLIKHSRAGGMPGKVRLMTTHRAKGLEFDQVYIMGAYDGHFGGKKMRELIKLLPTVYGAKAGDEADSNSDERRLFYVALTRARKGVMVSFAKESVSGKEQLPSLFLTEIGEEFKQDFDTTALEAKFEQQKTEFMVPVQVKNEPGPDRDFIQTIFTEQGLSVSALNNYLTCPWRYFYRNLIRLPEAKAASALYGTAVHNALADLFRRLRSEPVTKEELLAGLEYHLRRQPLTKQAFDQALAKGKKALVGWYDKYAVDWNGRNFLTEFDIKGVLLTPEIKLNGKIDKLEFTGSGNQVLVTDYKTRQPLTSREIKGETIDDDGSYFRQLVFYKLLLDRYDNGKYQMVMGEIDFIEPNSKGDYKKEQFEISDLDNKELVETIKCVASEITTLAFWSKRCEDKDCQYCALRNLIS